MLVCIYQRSQSQTNYSIRYTRLACSSYSPCCLELHYYNNEFSGEIKCIFLQFHFFITLLAPFDWHFLLT